MKGYRKLIFAVYVSGVACALKLGGSIGDDAWVGVLVPIIITMLATNGLEHIVPAIRAAKSEPKQ